MKKNRIVIDTNLWVSFLIAKNPISIEFLLLSQKFDVLFSNNLLDEFITVSSREKFRNYFPVEDISELTHILHNHSNFINVSTNITLCRDEKDDFLLNLSIDGKADYLITGDKDLLNLQKIENTLILTYSDFVKIMENV